MTKAYTLGIEEVYDKYLRDYPDPRKAKNGTAWKTAQEAEDCRRSDMRLKDFAVYELKLPGDWEDCVDPEPINGFYQLSQDTPIIGKVQ